jgi:hypothetical protein
MKIFPPPYDILLIIDDLLQGNSILLGDHLGGFDQHGNNTILHELNQLAHNHSTKFNIFHTHILSEDIKKKYKNLNILFSFKRQNDAIWQPMSTYHVHPSLTFKNFVCSFNGSTHVSRKLLTSILHKFGWFKKKYCSKNFIYSIDILDGHIRDYVGDLDNFYQKFFISESSEDFFQTIHSFGHVQYDHARNIYNLEHKLTQSFLHIVSETMATSYYPFVTEKFLYSVVTRGLFLAYAQPGWHAHLEKYYGFKRYTKLFDYRFDTIQNPVERLVELMSMISKFSVLSSDDWKDLYLLQQDEIDYNYDHYFSGDYLLKLNQWV